MSRFEEEKPRLNKQGWEVLDNTPPYMPAGFKRPETLAEQVRRLVKTEWSRMAEQDGQETFEEADDFDVGDDFDPYSPYETFFDPVLQREISPAEFERNADRYRAQYTEAHKRFFESVDREQILQDNLYRRAVRKKAGDGAEPRGSSEASPKPPEPSK